MYPACTSNWRFERFCGFVKTVNIWEAPPARHCQLRSFATSLADIDGSTEHKVEPDLGRQDGVLPVRHKSRDSFSTLAPIAALILRPLRTTTTV